MRVLIVEDERRLAQTLRDLMEMNGFTADVCYDGESGLDNALSGIYDVMILDVMLPKKDGFTVLRELRRAGGTVPVLMLTARSELADKLRFLRRVDRRNDFRSKLFCVLDRGKSDAAGARLHIEDIARFHAAGFQLKIQVNRRPDFRKGCGFNHRKSFRNRNDHARRGCHKFGISAAAEQRTDFVARFDCGIRGGFQDFAGNFESAPLRPAGGGTVAAVLLHQVGAVDRRSVDPDEDFIRFADRIGNLRPFEIELFVENHCVHGS